MRAKLNLGLHVDPTFGNRGEYFCPLHAIILNDLFINHNIYLPHFMETYGCRLYCNIFTYRINI